VNLYPRVLCTSANEKSKWADISAETASEQYTPRLAQYTLKDEHEVQKSAECVESIQALQAELEVLRARCKDTPKKVTIESLTLQYGPTAGVATTNSLQTKTMQTIDPSTLKHRAQALQLNGLLSNWSACCTEPWVANLLDWEEQEKTRRSMERRLHSAHNGRFKPLIDYDRSWPEQIDQGAVGDLMTLQFLHNATNATNAILVAPSGVGKTTIAQNMAHQAVLQGHTVIFTTAGKLLGERVWSGTIRRGTPPKYSCAGIWAPIQSAVVWRAGALAQNAATMPQSLKRQLLASCACMPKLRSRLRGPRTSP